MKTIGLIGGTTWESTIDYYRVLNEEVTKRAGDRHTARMVMYSVDFHDVEKLASAGKMDELAILIGDAAEVVERAGADCLLIGANTMHMFADVVQSRIKIPLIHIVKATLQKVQEKGYSKVGLLGTKPTMELDFYKNIFKEAGVGILIPDNEERQFIHDTIFNELFSGILNEFSRQRMIGIMQTLAGRGAQGVILGCTEIPLLVKKEHTDIPIFDSTYIHACAGVDFALSS